MKEEKGVGVCTCVHVCVSVCVWEGVLLAEVLVGVLRYRGAPDPLWASI